MSNENNSDLPRHAKKDPGAEVKVSRKDDGGVRVQFSDGSDDMEVSRREFMRISGVAAASAAMAGANCRYPQQEVVPYLDRPDETQIGHASHYATVCNGCSAQCGVLVKTRVNRPIYLKGNPEHPVNQGGMCARGESSYRRLYDPDREKGPVRPTEDGAHSPTTWQELDTEVANKLEEVAGSGGVRILTNNHTGSAGQAIIDEAIEALGDGKHYKWEPLNSSALSKAAGICYGEGHVPNYHFDQAEIIVSLGSDFLGTWMSPTEFTRDFSQMRSPDEGKMSRLITFEGTMTLTGMKSDERHRVRTSDLATVAMGLAHQLVAQQGLGDFPNAGAVQSALQPFSADAVAEATGVSAEQLTGYAEELATLAKDGGHSLVVAGGNASNAPNGVQLETAVNLLNAALGNTGHTVDHARTSLQDSGSYGQLAALVEEMNNGDVDVLIIDDVNPVYAAPPELDFKGAMENVSLVVGVGDRANETTQYADLLATSSNWLESWGDATPKKGTFAIQQPAIEALYDTRSFGASLLSWFANSEVVPRFKEFLKAPPEPTDPQHGAYTPHDPGAWYRYVRDHWKNTLYAESNMVAGFEQFWEDVLRQGYWERDDDTEQPTFRTAEALQALPSEPAANPAGDPGDLSAKELHTYASVPMYDGRWANEGHLQELPEPISKHTWGSFVLVSPATFHAADLEQGDVLEISVGDTTKPFPVIMQPGMHDDVVAVPLGYGRTEVGVVGNDVGENAFTFSSGSEDGDVQLLAGLEASLKKTGENIEMSIVQGSQLLDVQQRPILAMASYEEYKEDPHAGVGTHSPSEGLWDAHDYDDLKWGMSIDLTKCTGCSACVTACQEENNVPVVGRQGIMEGREMHWMRIDRYYRLPTTDQNEELHEARADLLDDPMYDDEPYIRFAEEFPESMDNPVVANQPMLCQHCERAPCETVCPVLATTHSEDGLNQMTYNRCVGTRYCANNCPFKVRRFNWFNYSRDRGDSIFASITPEMKEHGRLNAEEPLSMGRNPDVTVRSRGVMEKCTFCVQRIRRAKWQMREENRDTYHQDDVVTACEEACPAEAINFGSIHSGSDHHVRKDHENPRAVSPLNFLNVDSSIAYMSDIRNTHRAIAPGGGHGAGHGEGHGGGHGEGHGDAHGGDHGKKDHGGGHENQDHGGGH